MNTRHGRGPAASMLALILSAMPALASDNYFLNVPGIDGESRSPGFEEWIPINTFGLGFSRGTCTGVTVTKPLGVSSPALVAAVMLGTTYSVIEVAVAPMGEGRRDARLRLRLHNAVITSLEQAGPEPASAGVHEAVVILPSSVEMTYFIEDPRGGFGIPVTSTAQCRRGK